MTGRRNRYSINDEKREKWIKEGRGTGSLQSYKPWFYVEDVPTRGNRIEVEGNITKRYHQLLSNNEEACLHIYEYSNGVTDVQEQYPLLPYKETEAIAKVLNIPHPRDVATGALWVLTTDLLIYKDGKRYARTIKGDKDEKHEKSETDVWNLRMFERFEIERIYWLRRGVDWGLIERGDICFTLANNIRNFRSYYDIRKHSFFKDFPKDLLMKISRSLTNYFLSLDAPFEKINARIDKEYDLEPGTALVISYHLIATKRWKLDLYKPFSPNEVYQVEINDKDLL